MFPAGQEGNWSPQVQQTIRTELLYKTYSLLDDQTRQEKLSLQLVSFPGVPSP